MFRFALAATLLAVGCHSEPAKLRVVRVDVADESFPAIATLYVVNDGGRAATIDSVTFEIDKHAMIPMTFDADERPKTLEFASRVLGERRLRLPAGETAEVKVELRWVPGQPALPLLAAVSTTATLAPHRVTSPPTTFLLQTYPGRLRYATSMPADPQRDQPVLELLRTFAGRRSRAFIRLLESYESKREAAGRQPVAAPAGDEIVSMQRGSDAARDSHELALDRGVHVSSLVE